MRSYGRADLVIARSPSWVEEEDANKASSNELGPTISDISKFDMLSLNHSPPALDSTDGAVVHAGDMDTALPDSTILLPPCSGSFVTQYGCDSNDLVFWSEEQTKADWLLNDPTFDSVEDAFEYFFKIPAQESLAVAAQGRYEGSKEKIAENVNKWMSEEVMVAFQKYLEKEDLKVEYEFDELPHQCFHVENYCKIFHHFNFTVKLEEPGSSEWTSVLYFAEVKEILQWKIYFCCPLEPY
ncbi:hypothetical protein ACQ4PT_042496 [Festuca glaucescens]